MPKVAHISDIHFGPTFDIETWKNVRSQIEAFDPNLLIVSGDLVDHPSPFRLLAVKCELQSLCQSCKSRPQLFVVPGNHDVKEWGNFNIFRRKKWFERIMFNDTSEAKTNIQSILHLELGLNATSRSLTRWQKLKKAANPRAWIRRNVRKDKCDGRLQSCDYRRGGSQWPIESQWSQSPVSIQTHQVEIFWTLLRVNSNQVKLQDYSGSLKRTTVKLVKAVERWNLRGTRFC